MYYYIVSLPKVNNLVCIYTSSLESSCVCVPVLCLSAGLSVTAKARPNHRRLLLKAAVRVSIVSTHMRLLIYFKESRFHSPPLRISGESRPSTARGWSLTASVSQDDKGFIPYQKVKMKMVCPREEESIIGMLYPSPRMMHLDVKLGQRKSWGLRSTADVSNFFSTNTCGYVLFKSLRT